ncbi:kinesin-domain-containing protein [Clavulina sp. PMI_390]|nr:kinesin-domain-containing protein [Clavulina sp. PMI_390]
MSASITVAVRVRPPNAWEQEHLPAESNNDTLFLGDGSLAAPPSPTKLSRTQNLRPVLQIMDDHVLVFDPKEASGPLNPRGFTAPGTRRYKDIRYAFDRVFPEDARQADVYEATARPLLDGLFDGYNATVFAYGATGCGKTHTISGTPGDPGIIYLTMAELFQRIEDKREDIICEVSLSFLEIYNEEIRDLLSVSDTPRGGLPMREDQANRVTVAGLTEMHPTNAEEVNSMVTLGNERRTQSPTHANQTSSRSHAVLQVNVTQTPRTASTTEQRTMATLSIIDLAGSERASATLNMGKRMVEGANINKSLLALGNVINALCASGNQTRHIPYRNSKLTRLLRFSLGGNCKTVMICAVAPASNHYEDTQNTLKYANRAKEIKTKVSRNLINVNRHVGQYVEAINRLNEEVAQLKAKLAGKAGVEAEVRRRKKAEAKAELERIKADLAAKADQTRKTLVEGAAGEAHVAAAKLRLRYIHSRLGELDKAATGAPLSADLLAEQALLRSLAESDEALLVADGPAQRQLQKASNTNAMFDATLRAATERRSDRIDESGADVIRADAHLKRAEMDQVRAETRENVLQIALEGQAKFATELVGLLARCTVMMGQGSASLSAMFPAETGDEHHAAALVREVSERMSQVARGNDQVFGTLIGATTEEFQVGRDSALLKFTAHPSLASSTLRPVGRTSILGKTKPTARTSLTTTRRRSSVIANHPAPHISPRRLPAKSPRRPGARASLTRVPVGRAAEKKSVRWRDETSLAEIEEKGLRPMARQSMPQSVRPITPLVLAANPAAPKPKEKEESEADWEDERTEDSASVSSASTVSAAPSTHGSQTHKSGAIRDRLVRGSRPTPMESVGEETEGEESPRKPKRAPLGDVINSPPATTSRDSSPSRKSSKTPSTPTGSPSRASRSGGVPHSAAKGRRLSALGPMRVEKKSRRRSSLIPRPSPPSMAYNHSYAQPRKTPSKKRRISSVPLEGADPSAAAPARLVFAQSVSGDSNATGRKSSWR